MCENTSNAADYLTEYEAGVLIEINIVNVLPYTEASTSKVHDADILCVDLRRIYEIGLSNGNYGHNGDLRDVFLGMNKETSV